MSKLTVLVALCMMVSVDAEAISQTFHHTGVKTPVVHVGQSGSTHVGHVPIKVSHVSLKSVAHTTPKDVRHVKSIVPISHVVNKVSDVVSHRVVHTTHDDVSHVSVSRHSQHRRKVTNVTYYADGKCHVCISKVDLKRSVHSAAKRYDVPDTLITAVISQESAFKPNAKLGKQVGLMQVDLGWHRSKFHDDPYKPTVNIMVGTSILHDCLKRKRGDTTKALQCYNGGGDPRYASKVLSASYQVKVLL